MAKNKYYEYIIEYFNEIEIETKTRYGVVFAASYLEAIKSIEKYYGEHICKMTIAASPESSVHDFKDTGIFFNAVINAAMKEKENGKGQIYKM